MTLGVELGNRRKPCRLVGREGQREREKEKERSGNFLHLRHCYIRSQQKGDGDTEEEGSN